MNLTKQILPLYLAVFVYFTVMLWTIRWSM